MRFIVFIVFLSVSTLFSQTNPVGHWTFDDENDLTKAAVGSDLVLTGTQTAVAGPEDGNGAVRIGIGSYYNVAHGIEPNGGGNMVNEFSLVLDVKIPELGHWYCFYQTDLSNTNDGECFINPSGNVGVGDTYYTEYALIPNEWYRIGISVKNGELYNYYIDGNKELKGRAGDIDGRFALDTALLLFADNNSEDYTIDVADVKLFSKALNDSEMLALGGYHEKPPVPIAPPDTAIYPYLQSPTANSIYVCWHASLSSESKVEYGTTDALGSVETGAVHIFEDSTTWHWVKLTNLEPNTVYYYRAVTDTMKSDIFTFKTAPEPGQKTGHIRFAVIGDTRTYPNQFTDVVSAVKEKVVDIYGDENVENNLNLLLSNGDIVSYGPTLSQYKSEWFTPLAQISANVPIMVSIGDHEHDADNYYYYMKYEDFAGPQGEYYYSFQYGRVLFIAVHSIFHTQEQLEWLDDLMQSAENDSTIDWVIAFTHRPGHSEIWTYGNESYVQDHVIPIMNKYSKADVLTYGHSHAYERGQELEGNLRLVENGGGGAELDTWGEYPGHQIDYPEIQKTFDYWSFTLFDIDVENKVYNASVWAIGQEDGNEGRIIFDPIRKVDEFFRNKADETPPSIPQAVAPVKNADAPRPINLEASAYVGTYDILSSQFQITNEQGVYENPLVDEKRDFENIFWDTGAPDFTPIDKNEGIDLTKLEVSGDNLEVGKTYWWRVRYRDKNLQWSEWSEEASFTVATGTDVKEESENIIRESKLYENYPNPFNPSTTIKFDVADAGKVLLRVYSSSGELITTLINKKMTPGSYSVEWNGTNSNGQRMSSGVYFYKMQTTKYQKIGKAILIK